MNQKSARFSKSRAEFGSISQGSDGVNHGLTMGHSLNSQNHVESSTYVGGLHFHALKDQPPARKKNPAKHNKYQQFLDSLQQPTADEDVTHVADPCQYTCKWIQENRAYKSLCSSKRAFILLLHGKAGSGKSVLAKWVRKDLTRKIENDPREQGSEVLFYFCNESKSSQDSVLNMLQTVVFQLLRRRKSVFERTLAKDDFIERNSRSLESGWSIGSLFSIMERITADSTLDTLYCIIDSVDEKKRDCVREVLDFVVRLSKQSTGQVTLKFVLTTRAERHCRILAHPPPWPFDGHYKYTGVVRLTPKTTRDAMTVFVRSKLEDLKKERSLNIPLPDDLVDEVVDRSEGMFLWAKLAIDSLKNIRGLTASGLRNHLLAQPKEFENFYRKSLAEIRAQCKGSCYNASLIQRIFSWLIYGLRALNIAELSIVLVLESSLAHSILSGEMSSTHLQPSGSVKDDLEQLCGPLIEFHGESTELQTFVHFIHESAKSFIYQERLEESSPTFGSREKEIHGELAAACLAYLNSAEFAGGKVEASSSGEEILTSSLQDKLKSHPFLEYAALNWVKHFEKCCEESQTSSIADAVVAFFDGRSAQFESWHQIFLFLQGEMEGFSYFGAHAAASTGSVGVMRLLLDRGAELDTKNDEGLTLFLIAAQYGHVSVARFLIECGADIKAVTNDGCAAVHIASQSGHVAVVELLIQHKADVNAVDDHGIAAIHIAAYYGYTACMNILVQQGADIHVATTDNAGGPTALHCAALGGHTGAIDLLIQRGANVDARVSGGTTALHWAAMEGQTSALNTLIEKGADLKSTNQHGYTAFHLAAEFGLITAMFLLMQKGADINSPMEDGDTALHLAIGSEYFQIAVIEFLIEKGADPKASNQNGYTPLHFAAKFGRTTAIIILIQSGADINAVTKKGYTVLHLAATKGHTSVIDLLLQNGADANAVANDDVTPLHRAASKGHRTSVDLLLQRGANINAVMVDDNTEELPLKMAAIHLASEEGHTSVIEFLIGEGADVNAVTNYHSTPLHHAALEGHQISVDLLLQLGADINAVMEVAITEEPSVEMNAIHLASAQGHTTVLESLIKKGADVNSVLNNVTPLHLAASEGYRPCVDLLLQYGANINAVMEEDDDEKYLNMAAIHIASKEGHTAVTELLIEKGADVNAVTNDGYTALQFATEGGHSAIVELLTR